MKTFWAPTLFLVLWLFCCSTSHAVETKEVVISGNLNAGSSTTSIPTGSTFSEIEALASAAQLITVKDSLEGQHVLYSYYFLVSPGSWQIRIYADGGEIVSGTSGLPSLLGQAYLAFTSDGTLAYSPVVLATANPAWNNGSSFAQIDFKIGAISQFVAANSLGATVTGSEGCVNLALCVGASLPITFAQCSQGTVACSAPRTDYVLTPGELALNAVVFQGCNINFSTQRKCRQCYDKALKRLRYAETSRLFGNFMKEAKGQLEFRKENACRSVVSR